MNTKRFITNVGIVVVSTSLCILVSEIGLRVFRPALLVGVSHLPCIYSKNEQHGYTYRPGSKGWIHRNFEIDNAVLINSEGHHDVEYTYGDQSNLVRVVAIGDSFTACLQVPIPDMWTRVLQRELNEETRKRIEVVNLGLDGTGTDVHKDILQSYVEKNKVDLVVLSFYRNDIRDLTLQKLYREVYKGFVIAYQNDDHKNGILNYIDKNWPSPFMLMAYNNSYLFRGVVNTMGTPILLRSNFIAPHHVGIERLASHKSKMRADKTFKELLALSQEHNFDLVVIPLPTKEDPNESLHILTKSISREYQDQLHTIDIMPVMNKLRHEEGIKYRQLFWKYDWHFNSTGNRLYGIALATILEEEYPHLIKKRPNDCRI